MIRQPLHENKYFDLASATYECSTTGSITQLNVIPVGATQVTRVGKKCQLKSIQLRGRAVAGAAGTIADAAILVVYDKRPNSAVTVAITDVLNTANSVALNNADNEGRFKILARKDIVFTGNSVTPVADSAIINADFYIKVNMLPMVFKSVGTGAASNDVEEGAVYLITVGNTATGTTSPNLIAAIRTRFVE